MKNIIAISTSNNINSTTYKYIKDLIEKCKVQMSDKEEIKTKIFTPHNSNINLCCGCNKCFILGKCSLDKTDDMNKIKEELLNADLIILGTPVYFHNVTGFMKNFIDRLSYWGHLFRLMGKPCVIVISAYNNGMELVYEYLHKFSLFTGLYIINTIFLEESNKYWDPSIDEYVIQCSNYLLKKEKIKSTLEAEAIFKTMKFNYSNTDESSYEYKYWKENGYLEAQTYKDLLIKKSIL